MQLEQNKWKVYTRLNKSMEGITQGTHALDPQIYLNPIRVVKNERMLGV